MKRFFTIAATLMLSTGMAMAAAAVDLNTASKEQLASIKEIGPQRAEQIISYRTKNGPFASVDALSKAGLTQAQVNTLKTDNALTVAPVASAAATPTDNGAMKAPATTATTTNTTTTVTPAAAARLPNSATDKMAPSMATPSSMTPATNPAHSTTAAPAAPAAAPNAQ